MSTTETDFWSRIDSAQATNDASPETGPAPPADSTPSESTLQTAASPEQDSPTDEARADEARGDEARGDEARGVTAEEPTAVTRPANEGPQKSKSQRIREFLSQHSDVRNRDVVEALGEYGVTAADVANVRTQLRKKAEKQQSAKARVQSPAAPRAAGTSRRRGASASAGGGGALAAGSAAGEPISEIAISEIEAGLTFIERAGSIERARQVIDLVARIREINVNR